MPVDRAAPARLTPVLTRLIEDSVKFHTTQYLDLVYASLKAKNSSQIENVPVATLLRLQSHLLDTLQHTDNHKYDSSMQCLAVLALLCKSGPEFIEKPTEEFLGTKTSKPAGDNNESKHDYFTTKALKTLDFIVLKVIVALSESGKAMDVEFAVDVISVIDVQVRATWLQKKSSTVRKLCEKASRSEVEQQLRYSVCSVRPDRVEQEVLTLVICRDWNSLLGSLATKHCLERQLVVSLS